MRRSTYIYILLKIAFYREPLTLIVNSDIFFEKNENLFDIILCT